MSIEAKPEQISTLLRKLNQAAQASQRISRLLLHVLSHRKIEMIDIF